MQSQSSVFVHRILPLCCFLVACKRVPSFHVLTYDRGKALKQALSPHTTAPKQTRAPPLAIRRFYIFAHSKKERGRQRWTDDEIR